MTEISAAAVKALRDKTDLPMMLCKKALIEAEGDEEKAKEILKREGLKVKEKRADNPTEEGRIFTAVAADGDEAVMVEVVCESPPVATGQDMARFGEKLVKQFLLGPGATTPNELLAQKDPDGSGKPLAELFDEMVGVHLAGNLEMNGYANRGAVGERRGEFGVVGVKLKWLAIKRGLFALCDADTAGKRDSEHCQDDNDGKRRKRRKRRIGM